ncbi:MAG TPA: ATP-binding protein, partial [Armatimonadota bacterium]|nr:ATP-binding protein [Armatimonadota bacterium]
QMLAYSGKGHFMLEALDLSRLANEMASLLSASVTNRITLSYELSPDLPATEGDAGQLRQVLLNLVTNAAEAIGADAGIITVTTGVRRLDEAFSGDVASFGTLPPGEYAFLRVSDSGCGMDTQTLSRIYDPFFSTKFTGRGLGLAAVQGIVRGHHGSMLVESQPGAGSSFTALFPCAPSPTPAVEA